VVLILNSALISEELSLYRTGVPTMAHSMSTHHSFYVPYVTVSAEHSTLHYLSHVPHFVHKSDATTYYLGPETFQSYLEEHSVSFTSITATSELQPSFINNKTDLLVLYIEEPSAQQYIQTMERRLQELMNTFESAAFTRYVVAVTSLSSSLASAFPSKEELGIPEVAKRVILYAGDPTPSNNSDIFNTYFPGVFWELLVVLLVFWGVIGLGLSQLLQVQAPDRIPNLNAKKKK